MGHENSHNPHVCRPSAVAPTMGQYERRSRSGRTEPLLQLVPRPDGTWEGGRVFRRKASAHLGHAPPDRTLHCTPLQPLSRPIGQDQPDWAQAPP
eukprot:2443671-Pyramimonas_sp.AAC.1